MNKGFRFLLAIVTGILLSLAWLGFPGWSLFVAFIPLLFLDDFFVKAKNNFRSFSFFGYCFLTFLVWNLLTTWWIFHATPVGAAIAILLNAFFMALAWWIAHIARRRFTGSLGYIALVVFYLSFELCHYHWDIEWPWLTLGNGFANNIKMVQWYEYTGVFGGSLWILVANVILFRLLKQLVEKARGRFFYFSAGGFALLILVPIILSLPMYWNYKEKENPKEIVIIQPNIDPYGETYSRAAESEKLEKFIGLVRKEAGSNTDFIVGPETVVERYPDWEEGQLQTLPAYRKLNDLVLSFPKAEMVIGISSSKIFKPGEKLSATARTVSDVTFDVYNSALFINRKGESQVYHKSILVPGVEKLPYIKYLGFLKNVIINLGGASGSLGKQDEPTNFVSTNGTLVAPAICYESVFGEYLTKFVKKGAQFIFIITNDGWWKNTPGYRQHLSFARLRAIETRRSIARSANTGISCFINQRGDVSQKTHWWEDAVIKGTLNANDRITFYIRNGDYIARASAFISVLLLIILMVEKFRKKIKTS
jgi:apolipoprotein N-acyltransferase